MTQLQSPVLPSGGNLPPVFAPTRRSARPTPGEPIAVAVVPGNPAPIAPMRQTAPVQHVRPLPPVFVPPSFAPSARPAPVTPAPATVTRAPAPAAVRPSPVAVSPVAPAYAPADVPPPIFARPMPDAYAAKATGSKLSDAKYAQVPPPEVQVAHHQEIRQLSPKNAKREKAPKAKRKRHPLRIIAISLVLLLVAALAWPTHLLIRYNNQINHVEALSAGPILQVLRSCWLAPTCVPKMTSSELTTEWWAVLVPTP